MGINTTIAPSSQVKKVIIREARTITSLITDFNSIARMDNMLATAMQISELAKEDSWKQESKILKESLIFGNEPVRERFMATLEQVTKKAQNNPISFYRFWEVHRQAISYLRIKNEELISVLEDTRKVMRHIRKE